MGRCLAPVVAAVFLVGLSLSLPTVALAGKDGGDRDEQTTGTSLATPLLQAIADADRDIEAILETVEPRLRDAQRRILEGDLGSAVEEAARQNVALNSMRLLVKYDPVRIAYQGAEATAQALVTEAIERNQPVKAMVIAMALGMALSITPENTLDIASGKAVGKAVKGYVKAYSKLRNVRISEKAKEAVAARVGLAISAIENTAALAKEVAEEVQIDLREMHRDATE